MAAFGGGGEIYKNLERSTWGLTFCSFSVWSLCWTREELDAAVVKTQDTIVGVLLAFPEVAVGLHISSVPRGSTFQGHEGWRPNLPSLYLTSGWGTTGPGKMSGPHVSANVRTRVGKIPSCLWLLPSLSFCGWWWRCVLEICPSARYACSQHNKLLKTQLLKFLKTQRFPELTERGNTALCHDLKQQKQNKTKTQNPAKSQSKKTLVYVSCFKWPNFFSEATTWGQKDRRYWWMGESDGEGRDPSKVSGLPSPGWVWNTYVSFLVDTLTKPNNKNQPCTQTDKRLRCDWSCCSEAIQSRWGHPKIISTIRRGQADMWGRTEAF